MLKRFLTKWKQYRYRFVPWIAFNLKERTIRAVPNKSEDKIISDGDVLHQLTNLFEVLHAQDKRNNPQVQHSYNLQAMYDSAGFCIDRHKSCLPSGGLGVFVTKGQIKEGTVVSMYPGTIYGRSDLILFQSLMNQFVFRCIDGILIDGNDRNLSKVIYRSCAQRDRVGPCLTCDLTWLTPYPVNPLAIGQYVNNQSKSFAANVAYQELDIPHTYPFYLRQYIPNNHYRSSVEEVEMGKTQRLTRVVVLVSTRDIKFSEELFSMYFTVVH